MTKLADFSLRRDEGSFVPLEPLLVSKREAAKMLGGLHLHTIDRLLKRGKLKGTKVGSRMMIRFDSLKRFAEGEVA
jgi:excisionase family DNA binding protein